MIDPKERILFIVESPNKVKTIAPILKELGYSNVIVQASVGHISHIADSGEYNMGIDPKTFKVDFQITSDKKEIVNKLKDQVKFASKVILASDPDREGEAIAWSLKKFLNIPDDKYERITYHEITKPAIKKALENPRRIDEDLVSAAHTRSRLDKIVGYRLSPVARTNVYAKSVGRCQSAGLKIIVDREKEIQNFKPETYFELFLNFSKNKVDFKAKYIGDDKKDISKFSSKKECDQINEDCKKGKYIIDFIETKEVNQNAPLPFITSTFQQEVVNKLNLSSKDAMSYAQKLFEGIDIGGNHIPLITYHRTDDAVISEDFVPEIKKYIETIYGKKYYGGVKTQKKKENVQAGHEAIRCVDLDMTPENLSKYIKDEKLLKIYELIYKRTIASLMSSRKLADTQYNIKNGKHRFFMSSKEETFDGWKKVYTYEKEKEEVIKETFKENEELKNTQLEAIEKTTTPPSRYNEATLLKTLEKLGIGRPSTYATIIGTLLDDKRNYCKVEDKKLVPTDLGIKLVDFLDKNFGEIVNSSYTAELEKSLDKIAEGKLKDTIFLKSFYTNLEEDINKVTPQVSNEVCPNCGAKLVIRKGRYGLFLGCSNYPKCNFIKNLNKK